MTRLFLLLLLAVASASVFAGETLDAIDREQHVNKVERAATVVKRLQAAEDRPGQNATLAQRRKYQWLIALYASWSRSPEMAAVAQDALEKLDVMAATEDCKACALDAQLARAQAAFGKRNYEEAARLLADLGERASELDATQQLRLHQMRASSYRVKGLYAQGVAEIVTALELATRLGYTVDRVDALNMQVIFNAYLGDVTRAVSVAKEAMALAESIHYRPAMADIQLNLGFAYSQNGQQDKQIEAYQRGLDVAGNDPDSADTRAILLSNIADYWLTHQDYKKALDFAQRAESLARQSGQVQGRIYARTNIGIAKAHLGDLDAGISDITSAIAWAHKEGSLSDVIGITEELARVYAFAGRYQEAYERLNSIAPMQREEANQRRDRAVLELQEKYSAQSREREIERLADANKIKEAEISAQTWQRRMWAALAVGLGLAGIVLVQWLKRMRSANRKLSDDVAELEVQSSHDPLTGAFNRRYGHTLLKRHSDALRHAPETARPELGVMLLDVDFFKRVNDTYGHAAGDRVLVEVVRRLKSLLRTHDAVVRWGGEEFLLLLPDMRPDALPMLAEKVLRVIAETPIVLAESTLMVTISGGCVRSPFAMVTEIEELVQIADLALYRAKATGRNCAVCVTHRMSDLDMASLGQDLAAADAAGKVQISTISGPKQRHVA